MKEILRNTLGWIEQRTGLGTQLRNFFLEDIPASAGWPQVFGSVALFLFLTQALTGMLLALNYAPTPPDAYSSLTYIVREVAGGKMIRGLHHWGASLMIVVVVVHMLQVFLYGAYKKPREATWIAGVLLLLITLAFGLTGYLLPWDNRAYWGTVVTTRIAAQTPVLGSYLSSLLGAADGIGVVTFSRFYAFHTLLLPVLMVLIVAVHIYLVRRHGVTPSASDTHRKQRFYPSQAYRDTVAIFLAFLVLFAMAALVNAPLEAIANSNDATYVPRPEWYFLFLFQALKYFHGALEPAGSIGLPTATVLALFAVPFIDRKRACTLRQRTIAIGITVLALGAWGALTATAIAGTPKSISTRSVSEVTAQIWTHFPVEEIAAVGYFRKGRCAGCHNLGVGEPKPGPNLNGARVHHSPEWIAQHFNNPSQLGNDGSRNLSMTEINALSLLAARLTPEKAAILENTPSNLTEGAQVYLANGCAGCHKVNGVGGDAGPSLNGVANRRSENWVKKHFLSPSTLSPGSIMPPYQFSGSEQAAIVSYLFSLPD
jgi:ubiquinol-cytochrome c reductase cytochrome b subunit